jgi:hypothetical protein
VTAKLRVISPHILELILFCPDVRPGASNPVLVVGELDRPFDCWRADVARIGKTAQAFALAYAEADSWQISNSWRIVGIMMFLTNLEIRFCRAPVAVGSRDPCV